MRSLTSDADIKPHVCKPVSGKVGMFYLPHGMIGKKGWKNNRVYA